MLCWSMMRDASSSIAACGTARDWQAALKVYEGLESSDIVVENAMIHAMGKGTQWPKALELFHHLQQRTLEITMVTCGASIKACALGHRWEEALSIFHSIAWKRLDTSIIAANAVLGALARAKRWAEAMVLLRELGDEANSVTLRAALSACSDHSQRLWPLGLEILCNAGSHAVSSSVAMLPLQSCERASQWKEVVQLLRFMRLQSLEASEEAFTSGSAAIASFSERKQWEMAIHCLQPALPALRHGAVSHTSRSSLSALLQSCANGPDCWRLALGEAFLPVVPRSALRVTTKKGWALAIACCKSLCQSAVQLSNIEITALLSSTRSSWELQGSLLSALRVCSPLRLADLGALQSALAQRKAWQKSLHLECLAEADNVQSDDFVLGCMSSAMSVGPWHLALQFLRRVGAQKETLSSFATNGFWRMAATFLSEAMHVGLRISALAHSLLVSACEKRGAWEWSLRFCSGRLGTLSGTYNSVMSASEKSTYWPVSLQLLGELRAKEVEPSSVNFCTAISATDRGERPDLGLAVLWESLWLPLDLKISMLPWSLARLGISDPAWLHLACVELLEKRGTLSTVSSKELSNVAWSLGMSAVLLPAVLASTETSSGLRWPK
ncbi:unnamed protein product [Durusdinium trenchii]|uniref:Pentatricopeptide repeat-containing protein, chloroplastic n=1 Tax=Durusdinium trenchii TaxID=1381693 RepID=A0ABP0L6D8_9DINO